MNRSRHAIFAPLLAVLVLLLGLAGTASAAFNHAATEPHYGNFLLRESEVSEFSAYEIADPNKENGEWIYDGALGVPVYVRQNPWTFFDPLGLERDKDGVKITRDGHHVSPVETWRDNDSLSPEVRERLDSHRVKAPEGVDAPSHGNSKAHIKYTEKVRGLQQGYIDDAVKRGVDPSGLSGRAAKEFADDMVNYVMKDEYVSKFNSIISQGEGSTKNLNHMLNAYHKTGGKSGWSNSYKTASNWIGRGSKKIPIVGAIITTAGVAVAVSNAETAQQTNEALINGAFDATPAGLVIDASGLRHVSALMDTGARFNKDPNFMLNEESDGSWGANRASELSRGLNLRKQLMNE